MRAHELIRWQRNTLEIMSRNGLNVNHTKWLDLYDDYVRLTNGQLKVTYIVALLSERYGISEREVYRIVKKLSQEVVTETAV